MVTVLALLLLAVPPASTPPDESGSTADTEPPSVDVIPMSTPVRSSSPPRDGADDSATIDEPVPTASNDPHAVLVMDLKAGTGEKRLAGIFLRQVTFSLAGVEGLQVQSTQDIRRMLEFEQEKQTMGCETDSCIAELASAMGTRFVVSGTIDRVGSSHHIFLNLFDADQARTIAREQIVAALRGRGRSGRAARDAVAGERDGASNAPSSAARYVAIRGGEAPHRGGRRTTACAGGAGGRADAGSSVAGPNADR